MSSCAGIGQRLHGKLHVAVLAAAAGLLDVFLFAFGRLQNRLAVGHLRPAHVGLHAEFAHHAVDDDFQVQLAHAGNQRLPGIDIGVHAERGIFLRQLAERGAHFFLVRLGLGLDRYGNHRAPGNQSTSSTIGLSSSHSVSPVVTFFRPTQAAISPASTDSISSRLFACIRSKRPMRSRVFFVEL